MYLNPYLPTLYLRFTNKNLELLGVAVNLRQILKKLEEFNVTSNCYWTTLQQCQSSTSYMYRASGPVDRMSHMKRRETKQQPNRARSGNQISCCLVSIHFLCDILSTGPVLASALEFIYGLSQENDNSAEKHPKYVSALRPLRSLTLNESQV